MAVGYEINGEVAPLADLGWNRPCGQMYSTVEDLNKVSSYIFFIIKCFILSHLTFIPPSSWPCSTMRPTINHSFQSPICPFHMYCRQCWGGKWACLVRRRALTLLIQYTAWQQMHVQRLLTLLTFVSASAWSTHLSGKSRNRTLDNSALLLQQCKCIHRSSERMSSGPIKDATGDKVKKTASRNKNIIIIPKGAYVSL